jgi:hypothetical protein
MISGCASRARVVDISGYSFDVSPVYFSKSPNIKVDCGGSRMEFPLSALRNVKIDRTRITSIDGRLYFGAEIELKDGNIYGKSQDKGRCFVCADNGIAGRSSKSDYFVSFDKLNGFTVLDKDDK